LRPKKDVAKAKADHVAARIKFAAGRSCALIEARKKREQGSNLRMSKSKTG